MPIDSNFAIDKIVYHNPIPCSKEAYEKLSENKGDRLSLEWSNGYLSIRSTKPLHPALDFEPDFTKVISCVVKATGQSWWDFCTFTVDDRDYIERKGFESPSENAHALGLIRLRPDSGWHYLHSEEAE